MSIPPITNAETEAQAIPIKHCHQCDTSKEVTLFRKDNRKTSGYGSTCKECGARKRRTYYETNKQKLKQSHYEWVEKNKEYVNQYRRARKGTDPTFVPKVKKSSLPHDQAVEKRKQADREYRQKTAEHQIAYRKEYNASHRKENTERVKKREACDIQFKLANRLRARTRFALKAQSAEKAITSCELLGCSFVFFREWIERQFSDGMTWENWGKGDGKWNLDHIRPVSSFDLVDPEQQKMCFHYTNVRPLWAQENLSKGPKLCHVNT